MSLIYLVLGIISLMGTTAYGIQNKETLDFLNIVIMSVGSLNLLGISAVLSKLEQISKNTQSGTTVHTHVNPEKPRLEEG